MISPTQAQTMSVEDAAKILGISRGSAYAAVNAGEIPALRIGHRLLIPRQALEALLFSAGAETLSADVAINSSVDLENHHD